LNRICVADATGVFTKEMVGQLGGEAPVSTTTASGRAASGAVLGATPSSCRSMR